MLHDYPRSFEATSIYKLHPDPDWFTLRKPRKSEGYKTSLHVFPLLELWAGVVHVIAFAESHIFLQSPTERRNLHSSSSHCKISFLTTVHNVFLLRIAEEVQAKWRPSTSAPSI